MIQYSNYVMSWRQKAVAAAAASGILFAIGYIFYHNLYMALLFSFCGPAYIRIRRSQLQDRRKRELTLQFKQALYSLSSLLGAGRSVENSFRLAARDMMLLYQDKETMIIRELDWIQRKIDNGEPVEKALFEFSSRAGIEDIANFCEVFNTCKRTGGDLIEVIRRTSNMIGEKLEIQLEIEVMVAQKKFEAKLMGYIPFAIIAFLSFSSPDYMAPLYSGIGFLLMTAILLVILFCQWLTGKIVSLHV